MSEISKNLLADSVYDKTAGQDDPWYQRYAVPIALAGISTAALLRRRVAGKKVAELLNKVGGLNPVGGPTDAANRLWRLPEGELAIRGGKPVNVGFNAEGLGKRNRMINEIYHDIASFNQDLQKMYDLQKLQSGLGKIALGSGAAALSIGAHQAYKDKTSGVKSLFNRIGRRVSTSGQGMKELLVKSELGKALRENNAILNAHYNNAANPGILLRNTLIGAGLGTGAGAGLGYIADGSRGAVLGGLAGAGLGGYGGYNINNVLAHFGKPGFGGDVYDSYLRAETAGSRKAAAKAKIAEAETAMAERTTVGASGPESRVTRPAAVEAPGYLDAYSIPDVEAGRNMLYNQMYGI